MSNRKQIPRDPRKRNFDLNINEYQDVNNVQRDTITANAVLHQHPYSTYPSLINRQNNMQNIPHHQHQFHHSNIVYPALSPSASASTSASSIFSAQTRHNDLNQIPFQNNYHTEAQHPQRQSINPTEIKQVYEYSEAEQKFQFHYNLLIFMRHPQQYAKISYDASISAIFILIWCAFNMIFGFSANESLRLIPTSIGEADPLNIEKLYQRQEIFHNLVVFGIAVLNIHKDIILCNAQLCLPMLLLFNFTVRFSIQYLIQFEMSWDSVNFAFILVLLWFMCCRFFFNIFKNDSCEMDIHWNLMRCHFFYRGFYIRWMAYLIYSWFNALMVLQLMDSVCLSDGTLQSKLCKMHRIKFIGCDMVIVVYCIMVLGIWNKLQMINEQRLKRYKLSVASHGVQEMFVFIGMLVMANFVCENFLSRLIVKKMLLPITVVVILVANFLMR